MSGKKFKILQNPTFKEKVNIPRIGGEPIEVEFEFNSLYQMSEIEKANLAKTEADTQAVLIDNNLKLCEAGVRSYEAYSKELGYGDEYTELEPETEPTEPPTVAEEGDMVSEDDLKAE